MYITPTVTGLSNFSPVLPSYSTDLPSGVRPTFSNNSAISYSEAPSNTGVAIFHPSSRTAAPKCTSKT